LSNSFCSADRIFRKFRGSNQSDFALGKKIKRFSSKMIKYYEQNIKLYFSSIKNYKFITKGSLTYQKFNFKKYSLLAKSK